MKDLLTIITTAEANLRAASREAFRLSVSRATIGATQEASTFAHAGIMLGGHADDLMRAAGDLKRAQEAAEKLRSAASSGQPLTITVQGRA